MGGKEGVRSCLTVIQGAHYKTANSFIKNSIDCMGPLDREVGGRKTATTTTTTTTTTATTTRKKLLLDPLLAGKNSPRERLNVHAKGQNSMSYY